MNESVLLAIAVLLLAWSVLSGVLARHNLTGPLLFMVAGFLLSNPSWGPLPVDIEAGDVHTVAEATLALVLFADASRVNLGTLRHDIGIPLRLLAVGLPLTLAVGGLTALVVFDDLPWSLALFVGAALAPTDAALSAQVISDERVPMRLRRALNVESGLNDGIATPVVTLALAVAGADLGLDAEGDAVMAGAALRELSLGVVAGVAVGALGAVGVNEASTRDLALPGGRRLAALATALAAFALALAIGANGFIAAFVAGIAFGTTLDRDATDAEDVVALPELGGELLALVVWFLFGAGLIPVVLDRLSVPLVGYAVLSLVVFRAVPVGLSLIGARLSRRDALFLGWFGPRGLASVVFALLAVELLGEADQASREAVAAVAMTVMLSVVLHGVTAGPAGDRYGRSRTDESVGDVDTTPRPRSSHIVAE
jgi:NhaP-type Na+/H+ or K+/H+ antiporter